MKMFRRAMAIGLAICLAALFIAVLFRIRISQKYPESTVQMIFTPALTEHYREDPENFKAETQNIRFPYDSADDGNFFANALIVVRDAGNLQVTVRYNESTLPKVAEFYKLKEVPEAEVGLFRYTLTASYNEDAEGEDYKTYSSSFQGEASAYMYHYAKLAFDGVDFEGAAWMRVDIYYADEAEPFGHICVYEARAFDGEKMVDMPFSSYEIDEEVLPQ